MRAPPLVTLLLLAASSAAAEPAAQPAAALKELRLEELQRAGPSRPDALGALHEVVAHEPASPLPRAPTPVLIRRFSGTAAAPGLRRLGLFADASRFRRQPGVSAYELRGGAYLRLLHRLHLRGAYRFFDPHTSAGTSPLARGLRGPLFGLHLDF